MSLRDRGQDEVRRMLDGPHPLVPPDLAARAAERGQRILARRRVLRAAGWALLVAAAAAFAVWAAATRPWDVPPAGTTPPLEGW
ncbi:hypothetical protein AB0C51_04815 [Streptomyces pathocidini]|uniref:hypothetical protein n=1 Tax=Streptomyces pathocidini TaxID=1650571 RepID=UPI0033E91451